MVEATGLFLLGLVLLALGGDSLVKGASGLGRRMGLSELATGVLLVTFATSVPELAVNARAAWTGQPALALGNAVGSNLVNFGLTLGLAAIASTLVVRWRALTPLLLCFLLASALVVVLGWDGALTRLEGLVLLLAFVAVVAFALAHSRAESPEVLAELAAFEDTRTSVGLNVLRLVVASAVLFFGARLVVQASPVLGQAMGMSPLVTGLLPVAIGTGLPEIAAALMAARRGQGDVVAGHVVGASLFNLTVVVGGMAVFRPVALPESFVRLEVPASMALALALYPMLRGDLRVGRGEGAILVAVFLAWVAFELYMLRA